jgi:non-specific serine/threonine protein kinase
VAGDLRRRFADGVWFVELGNVQDPALVAHAVNEALRIQDDTARGPVRVLVEYVRDREILLLLDNCEHLVAAVAELLDPLLRSAPRLTVLATSREVLGIVGEHVRPVRPLPVPAEQRRPPDRADQWPAALRLFAERAAAAAPDFTVGPDNVDQVAQFCRLLDGLPLGIELAAVRLRALPLEQLLSNARERWSLNAGSRSGPSRHRSLRSAVSWSHELCTPVEQLLWARASVFAGTFDLPAARSVCADDRLPADSFLDVVSALIDKSVLIRDDHDDRPRYRLLEPLRQFGIEQLRKYGQEDAFRHRHRDHYLRFAERSEADWFGAEQPALFVRTRLEQANLRAALDFSLGRPGEAAVGLRLAGDLWFYWAGCGMLAEGRYWLERALRANVTGSGERARALWVYGYVCTLQGDLPAAVAVLEECRDYGERCGDDTALAYGTHRLGCTMLVGDDVSEATKLFADARQRYQDLGELNSNVMLADIELAIALIFQGEPGQAADLCRRALAVGEQNGEQWARAYAIFVLALVALDRGDLAEATRYGRESLRLKQAFHDLLGMVLAIEVLAWSAAAAAGFERAAVLLGAAGQIWRSVGYPMFGSRYFGAPRRACETATRDALGAAGYDAALQRGRQLSFDEAAAYALDDEPAPDPDEPVSTDDHRTVLTPREQQVAEQIAKGLSNKEIAAALLIAPRTAESHVERILQKLGFSRRAQVAAWISGRNRDAT